MRQMFPKVQSLSDTATMQNEDVPKLRHQTNDAPKVSATPASCHVIIHLSDSEELEEILNGGASSDD
jgi:hypothetical protein